jgi:methionine-S-sulfoxide reductase
VGYAGGESRNPTYHNLGNHTESLEVDFDPEVLTFGDVLEVFWQSHNPFGARRKPQYMSALFWHDERQRDLASETAARISNANDGAEVTTQLLEFDRFYLAEDYHQKYILRRHSEFESALLDVYPDLLEFTNSTAAARLNGYLAGHGTPESLARDLPLLGLNAAAQESDLLHL